jgi:hypothetical protein
MLSDETKKKVEAYMASRIEDYENEARYERDMEAVGETVTHALTAGLEREIGAIASQFSRNEEMTAEQATELVKQLVSARLEKESVDIRERLEGTRRDFARGSEHSVSHEEIGTDFSEYQQSLPVEEQRALGQVTKIWSRAVHDFKKTYLVYPASSTKPETILDEAHGES